jgi:CubicO group peptidase (beta-lactamase class C family)
MGEYGWAGAAGTFFFIDPKDDLFVICMMQTHLHRGRIEEEMARSVYEATKPELTVGNAVSHNLPLFQGVRRGEADRLFSAGIPQFGRVREMREERRIVSAFRHLRFGVVVELFRVRRE